MSLIDLHGFVANLKDHVVEHGFHVHGDRHFVETYSNRQTWEVDLHPDHACGGPLDMVLIVEAESRTLLAFEDEVNSLPEDKDPDDAITVPMTLSFVLPPLHLGPDLLVLATELSALGGTELPLQLSSVDRVAAVTDAAERTVNIEARLDLPLSKIYLGQDLEVLCDCSTVPAASVSSCSTGRQPGWASSSRKRTPEQRALESSAARGAAYELTVRRSVSSARSAWIRMFSSDRTVLNTVPSAPITNVRRRSGSGRRRVTPKLWAIRRPWSDSRGNPRALASSNSSCDQPGRR